MPAPIFPFVVKFPFDDVVALPPTVSSVVAKLVEVALVVVPLTENRLVMVEVAALIKIPLSVVVGESVIPSESSSNVLPNISDGLA